MNTKIYYVETNAYSMIVADHGDFKRVISNECAILEDGETPLEKIQSVEDDTSWELYEDDRDIEDFLEIDYNDSETPRILAEAEIDL